MPARIHRRTQHHGGVTSDDLMPGPARLRRAEARDAPAILRVERAAHAILRTPSWPATAWTSVPSTSPRNSRRPHSGRSGSWRRWRPSRGAVRLSEQLDAELLALDQVSVDPPYAGHGIGRQLLTAALTTARELGYCALTGTTFRDVAFNAPFYATLGSVEDPDPHPAMLCRRKVERELGLDKLGARLVMRLPLGPAR